MITLVTYPAQFGTASASPFCVKAMYLLNMSGLAWTRQDTNDPRAWPNGKLPAIQVGTDIIGDSEGIRAYLETQGADLDPGLSDLDKANARAFTRMAEEHMYFVLLLDRWADPDVWPAIRDAYFVEIPKPVRGLIAGKLRRGLLAGMRAQGLGRLSAEARLARVEQDLNAITQRLWQGPFLFGSRPTSADASVGAMLQAMAATPVATPLSRRVGDDPVLRAYLDRITDQLG